MGTSLAAYKVMRDTEAFTDLELAFFRAGELLEQGGVESWEDLASLPIPAVLKQDVDEDEWEWEIAIARARVAA